jgi:TatD DNase family protein
MLIDTHCHINMMVKETFDTLLHKSDIITIKNIIDDAHKDDVTYIINVGTSVIESENCIQIAQAYAPVYATVGIHPNDCTVDWKTDIEILTRYVQEKEKNKIVGIGEIGLDRHYKDHNLPRQKDAFRAQIELALAHNLAIVVHTRDAYDETLHVLSEYRTDIARGIIHCFSEDLAFAQEAINMNFALGIGGIITYPKNNDLRHIVTDLSLDNFVLETDAPFLPPQIIRGKQNHPKYIKTIAEYMANLRNESYETVAHTTTRNAFKIFGLDAV